MQKKILIIIAIFIWLSTGCGQAIISTQQTTAEIVDSLIKHRDELTVADLMAASYQGDSPVDNTYYVPIGETTPTHHNFEGTLRVPEFKMKHQTYPEGGLVRDRQTYFPGFSVEFFSVQDHLVPANRKIIPPAGDKSFWSAILNPGRVWSEPGDDGLSRASFPFILVADDSNEAHNGLATFLFDGTQVSSLRMQITQETAAWNITDFWGQTPIEYSPHEVKDREALASQFTAELNNRFPTRPWADLETDYDPALLTAFNGDLPLQSISATGLVLDGTLFLQPCNTRFGEFPYCTDMRHGAFSVTKSIGAAIALLRLAEKYGEHVYNLKIADYVEVTANHDGWDSVTFEDVINMATGVGEGQPQKTIPNDMLADENLPQFTRFMQAKTAQEKLAVAFSYEDYPWGPGEVARYNSTATFVLSAAMDSYLKDQEGSQADIWDMVVEKVYRPIGIYHAPIMRTIEPDGSRGLPIFAWGLFPTIDEAAKIAQLIQNGGRHQGQQILHAGKLAELFTQGQVTGLPTGEINAYGDGYYHLSFWSISYCSEDERYFQIPYMSGFGGNRLIFTPNNIVSIRFTDSHDYNAIPLIRVSESLRPFPGRGVETSQLKLLKGIWVGMMHPTLIIAIDRLLLAWIILTLGALVFLLWDYLKGLPGPLRFKFAWAVVIVFFGPLGFLAYLLSYRIPIRSPAPLIASSNWRRSLGTTAFSVTGNGIGVIMAGLAFETFPAINASGPVPTLVVFYTLPFITDLLLFRVPLTAFFSGIGGGPALAKSLLPELLSTNMVLAGMIPIAFVGVNKIPFPITVNLLNPSFWLLVPLLAISGAILGYPLHLWMNRGGLVLWLPSKETASPSNWIIFAVVLLTIVLWFISVALTIMTTLGQPKSNPNSFVKNNLIY